MDVSIFNLTHRQSLGMLLNDLSHAFNTDKSENMICHRQFGIFCGLVLTLLARGCFLTVVGFVFLAAAPVAVIVGGVGVAAVVFFSAVVVDAVVVMVDVAAVVFFSTVIDGVVVNVAAVFFVMSVCKESKTLQKTIKKMPRPSNQQLLTRLIQYASNARSDNANSENIQLVLNELVRRGFNRRQLLTALEQHFETAFLN